MLAPESLRPGSSPVEADRRRTVRLVVVAVVAALLAVAVPTALAVVAAAGDDAAPTATAHTGIDPLSVPASNDAAAPGPAAATTTAPTTADAAPSGAADPAASVTPEAGATEPSTDSPVEPTTAAVDTDPSTAAAAPVNWMEELRPQVDPEGLATWVFQARGAWGASDGHTVYIDPNVPADKRWSVMVHEYGHVLQVQRYGSLDATAAAMNAIVGAGPMDKGPTESNADCIAEQLGATWTDYGCQDALRPAAAALVAADPASAALAARS